MKKYFAILATFIMAMLFFGCIQYSEGTRTGYLIKFSRKGLMFKTWEGTMNLGGGRSGDNGAVPNTWDFTVDPENAADQSLIPVLNTALEKGKRVKVTYSQEAVTGCGRSDSNYFLKSVEVAE